MTEYKANRSNRAPTHPGTLLKEEVLPALELSIMRAAELLGVSRAILHKIVAGNASITPEMALRIGKLAGNGPDLWLNMQHAFDLWHARNKMKSELERIPSPRKPVAA